MSSGVDIPFEEVNSVEEISEEKRENFPDHHGNPPDIALEPEKKVDCADLNVKIEDKKEARRRHGALAMKMKTNGFDRGLQVEKIIWATDCTGELTFLIKWRGIKEADFIPARLANVNCPQAVIKFYEERIYFYMRGEAMSEPLRRCRA